MNTKENPKLTMEIPQKVPPRDHQTKEIESPLGHTLFERWMGRYGTNFTFRFVITCSNV